MEQYNFFGKEIRWEQLEKHGDPLRKLNALIDWEIFRAPISAVFRKEKKSAAGRPPYDRILLFKILILEALYTLSDVQAEYQILDRYSFSRFLGLAEDDRVPDATTIWLFRDALAKAGIIDELFLTFKKILNDAGFLLNKGSIVDATFVDAPRQRNTPEENKTIKSGETPEAWKEDSQEAKHKLSQKDVDARWAKKGNELHYGYKNHTKVDRCSKLITGFTVTPASTHDSKELPNLVEAGDGEIYADSAYSSCAKGLPEGTVSRICKNGCRHRKLTEDEVKENRELSRIRSRVEHVYGWMTNVMGGPIVRSIGITRAKFKIGMQNIAYNMCRYSFLRGQSLAIR